jgi:CheY-like chemotaxis protein
MPNAEGLTRGAATVDGRAVLLVEDNLLNQMVADGMLRLLGYTSRCVMNGLEALHELRSTAYSIVLMDIHMPELDGFETTRRIRAEMPIEQQPYIIAVTANAMPGDAERCRAAGMDDYVSKPLSKEALRAAMLRAKRRVES